MRKLYISAFWLLFASVCAGGCKNDPVSPPAADSPVVLFSNSYHNDKPTELNIERSVIYDPVNTWHYSHHPSVVSFKGQLIAIFSNGVSGEDDPGQRIMISTSSDFVTWSAPKVLVAPTQGDYGHLRILTPGGITTGGDGVVVYFTDNDSDGTSTKRINPRLYAITSNDGVNWSQPKDMFVSLFPCHRPLTFSAGRRVMTGNTAFYYSDDAAGLKDWIRSSTAPQSTEGLITFDQIKPTLCEGALLQHSNGLAYCLLRSTGKTYDGFLWQSQSSDNGASWTKPVKSRFTDNNSKSCFGVLPDQRYFYVGTPDTLSSGGRHPLVLALSDDGFNFNRTYIISNDYYIRKYKGKWKTGDYGYPFAIVDGDYLYVMVSRWKERMEILRFPLSQLK